MTDTRKQQLKQFIIRTFEGKVKRAEIQAVRVSLMNYSREEWRELKIIGQELVKEAIDEKISELPDNKVSSEWKSIFRDFSHSGVNLFFAIFNEEVLYQSMLLEKQGGLTEQQKVIKILPVLSREIDKVAARASSRKPSNYHKVETSVVKKIKNFISEIEMIFVQKKLGKRWSEEEGKQKVSKWIRELESLTVEELAVLKEKSKLFMTKLVNNYAPAQVKNSPEIMQLINSSVNLACALCDEKSAKNLIDIIVKVGKLALQNPELLEGKESRGENRNGKWVKVESNPLDILKKAGLESEAKNLLKNLAQHLNSLSGEGEQNKNSLSSEKEEVIVQNLTKNFSQQAPTEEENINLGDILQNNLLTQNLPSNLGDNSSSKELNMKNLLKDFKEVFATTQSKGKWYKNPWFIGFSVVGAFVVGGLIVWLLTRRKKERIVDRESNF